MATNFGPESTPIDPNIVMLVKSYLSRIYIERETDFKTTFLANFALTTPLMEEKLFGLLGHPLRTFAHIVPIRLNV